MTNQEDMPAMKTLNHLKHQNVFIIKPSLSDSSDELGATERGKIVTQTNQILFDYQIGDKLNASLIDFLFYQRILLIDPNTKNNVLELYENRFPCIFQSCLHQPVQWISSETNIESRSIGSVQRR